MFLPTDRIVGVGRGNAAQFIRWIEKRGGAIGPYREWVYAVEAACDPIGIDHSVIWFQGEFETGGFKSEHWIRGNSGGLGITDDDAITPFDIRDIDNPGQMAAYIHVASMYAVIGRYRFKGLLQPAYRTYARAWIDKLVDLAQNEPDRPVVRRIDDLNIRYRGRDGRMRATWAWDEEYVNKMTARAMASSVQIPSQRYLHEPQPFSEPKRFKIKYHASLWEGPSITGNRRLDVIRPGQYIYFNGIMHGHAALGDPVWYYTGGPVFGFVHRSAVE